MASPPFPPPAPSLSRPPPPSGLRFREALTDFRTLLGRAGGGPPAPFHLECLDRWANRWSDRTLRGLGAREVLEYFQELSWNGHTHLEIERERGLLRSLFRWAQRSGRVQNDPTVNLGNLLSLPRAPAPAWSAAEQRRLLDAARGFPPAADGAVPEPSLPAAPVPAGMPLYLYPLVLLGLRTGLRLDELLRLEWRHVNLWRRRIRADRGELRGAGIDLPLSTDAVAVLAALRRFGARFQRLPRLVFAAAGLPVEDGEPDEESVLGAFRKARDLAGLTGDFASLRLAFARNCACAGVPMQHVVAVYDWGDRQSLEAIYERHGSPLDLDEGGAA